MAGTPDSFTGLYARPTANLPGPDGGGAYYATALYLECFYVDGMNGMTHVATIPFTMPTGCVAFQGAWVRFDDAGYMYTAAQGAKYANFAAAGSDTDWSREIISKYQIADDGSNQLLWQVQTPFSSDGNLSRYITFAPDGSWGALFGVLPIDCGTGAITYPSPQLIDSPDDPGHLVYPIQYQYLDAGYGNTLLRQKLYLYDPFRFNNPHSAWGAEDSTYALVASDGSVASQADWDALGWKSRPDISDWGFNRALSDYFSTVTVVYPNSDGTTFDHQQYVLDPATCLPVNPGSQVNARDGSAAGHTWSERLPGGGRRFEGTGGSWYIPWRASSTGSIEPALSEGAVLLPKVIGVSHNGLVINEQPAPDNFPTSYDQYLTTFTYGFIDTDGRYAERSSGTDYLHQPAIAIWDFRPNLPVDSITAGIESTRTLFTAV
jgi:hypothetical protein